MRVCGRGGALTNAPLVQSKSYFEVKIQQSGVWAIGLATRSTNLNTEIGGQDAESWVLNSDGVVRHNQEELHKVQNTVQEGDIIVRNFNTIFTVLTQNIKLLKLQLNHLISQSRQYLLYQIQTIEIQFTI